MQKCIFLTSIIYVKVTHVKLGGFHQKTLNGNGMQQKKYIDPTSIFSLFYNKMCISSNQQNHFVYKKRRLQLRIQSKQ